MSLFDVYNKYLQFAVSDLLLSPLQEDFSTFKALDGKTELKMCSFQAPKIRLLRSLSIESSDGMQVLDFAVFPEAEYDLPIFCANFFTSVNTNIFVLDLNPLHDVMDETHYKDKVGRQVVNVGGGRPGRVKRKNQKAEAAAKKGDGDGDDDDDEE